MMPRGECQNSLEFVPESDNELELQACFKNTHIAPYMVLATVTVAC